MTAGRATTGSFIGQRRLFNVVKLISEGVWAGTMSSYLEEAKRA